METGRDTARLPGEAFVAAVVARDAAGLAAVLDERIEMRALVPKGLRAVEGRAAAAALVCGWFADASSVELLERTVDDVADRVHVGYRLRVFEGGGSSLIEQHAFADVAGGLLTRLDLVCSGFRAEPTAGGATEAATPAARRFDAGALGCGDGLPAAFRREISSVAAGERLEVVVADPAAKADLPSLARMMGHRVETTEALADGRVRIVVERGQP